MNALNLQDLQGLPLEQKVLRAQAVLAQALNNHRPVVAWSGGKDSTVLLHLALKMEPGILVIFNDVGVDFPENRRYVHQLAQAWKVNLHIAKPVPGVSFWTVAKKYGYPMLGKRNTPGHQHLPETYARGLEAKGKHRQAQAVLEGHLGSTCCEFLKERPYRAMMKALGADCNITGILAGESQLRTLTWLDKGEFYQDKRGMWKATPLATWTDADVEAYLAQHQVPPNPLYQMGYHRNGCWPCLQDLAFADNKLAIMRLAHPKLWRFLIVDYGLGRRLIKVKLALNDNQADMFAERWGGDLEELLRQRPCFFDRL